MQCIRRDEERDDADHAGHDEARIHEFEKKAVRAEQDQEVGDARIGDDGEELRAPIAFHFLDRRAGDAQHAFVHGLALELRE